MNNKEVYFDLGAYKTDGVENKSRFINDLVAVTLENAEAPLEERITPYEINFNKEGEPNFELRWKTETDFRENEALFKVRDLMKKGSEHLLWISPPSKEIGYKESRMVIFINKGIKENGDLNTECRGICSEFGEKGCLKIARSLGYDFKDGEELRSNPIEFKVGKDENWVGILEGKIEIPKVWQAIRNGKDTINKEERKKIAIEIVDDFIPRIKKGMSNNDRYFLGSQMERALEIRGIKLQANGSCGISNSEALELEKTFDVVFKNSLKSGVQVEGYKYFCKPCNCFCKEGICPICKKKLSFV